MKKLSVLLLSLLSASMSFAQSASGLHFGLKAAPALAWLRSDTKGFESDGSKFGFSYGLMTDFNFANNYAFATGVDIAYRGGKFKSAEQVSYGDTIVSVTRASSYTLQYIEIPVTLKLKTNEIGYLTYYLQIGLSPGVNIRARENYESTTQTTLSGTTLSTVNEKIDGVDVKKNINNINFAMIIGGGVEYTLSGSTVLLMGLQFNNGFMDVFDDEPKVNSNYLALTLAVLF